SDATQIAGDTVTIDENKYGNENGGAGGQYNSSSDGFQSIYFEFGRYDITPDMENRMASNADIAKSKGKIKLEGNCDEFGTDEFNFALGLKRANAVKQNLISRGVSPTAVTLVSLGESKPLCSEPTEQCYAKNRRVDFHGN
ncbi:MAG: OmpA family protein, partial [Campylobacterota bacterium]|nr:OmpA family protein [Campylobacterota bacterium]